MKYLYLIFINLLSTIIVSCSNHPKEEARIVTNDTIETIEPNKVSNNNTDFVVDTKAENDSLDYIFEKLGIDYIEIGYNFTKIIIKSHDSYMVNIYTGNKIKISPHPLVDYVINNQINQNPPFYTVQKTSDTGPTIDGGYIFLYICYCHKENMCDIIYPCERVENCIYTFSKEFWEFYNLVVKCDEILEEYHPVAKGV